jgi:hypothetical protein
METQSNAPAKLSSHSPQPKKQDYYGMPQPTEEEALDTSHAPDNRTHLQKVINDMTFGLAYIRNQPVKATSYIPVGMTLYLRQKGFHDIGHTIAWRVVWLILLVTLFGVQFDLYERHILFYRLHFWCLVFAIIYFFIGIIHVTCKSLDKSWTTRLLQMFYVLATSFTMASSLYYIFLLFMDDISRKNPRGDDIFAVISDGYQSNTYLRSGPLNNPETVVEFVHKWNSQKKILHPSRYNVVWFIHIACHIVLPVVLMVPLYVENTRIYYTDFLFTIICSVSYTALLWIGTQASYNRNAATPCVGSTNPYCAPDKVNPEYKIIYWKLNFFQRGETASYILLFYIFVFVSFYLCRAISKRYARSAALSYNLNKRNAPVSTNIKIFNPIPDEQSERGSTTPSDKNKILKNQIEMSDKIR